MDPDLAILVPVLGRPHRVVPLLDSASETAACTVHFLASPDDRAEIEAIEADGRGVLEVVEGNYAQKINHACRVTASALVFLGADDLLFHPGWLTAACRRLTAGIGVVGTNDLCNPRTLRGEHSTHSLVAREYISAGTIDDPRCLLHEGYPHEYVDDEFIETAKHRGAYAHAHSSIVEHLHPMVGKAPVDRLYAGQRRRMRYGRRLYERRRHLWT